MTTPIAWPDKRSFAFTIFDDPDSQTFEASKAIYGFLQDCGFRTTKGVWPTRATRPPSDHGMTCGDSREYVDWLVQLQGAGFEIALHNATSHTSTRAETLAGLEQFAKYFGCYPKSMANHYFCQDTIYWGENRVTGSRRLLYNLLTRGKNRNISYGHDPKHPYFWGDACKEKIKYVRNFAFARLNTLRACPPMPYHDPLKPYVNYWFASSEGSKVETFLRLVTERNLDQLEEERGACIMYVHFGHRFFDDGAIDQGFRAIMQGIAKRNGWFVPVSTLLDFLLAQKTVSDISEKERAQIERRWLLHKARFGTA
jgi:hypothetical protein